MEKEFVTYEQALPLKELGFDEPCLGFYDEFKNNSLVCGHYSEGLNRAPTFSQAFRFLRDKYYLASSIQSKYNKWSGKVNHRFSYGINKPDFLSFGESINYWEKITDYETFDDAQRECLNYLIDLAKKENQ